jgi:hypothetical protein
VGSKMGLFPRAHNPPPPPIYMHADAAVYLVSIFKAGRAYLLAIEKRVILYDWRLLVGGRFSHHESLGKGSKAADVEVQVRMPGQSRCRGRWRRGRQKSGFISSRAGSDACVGG